MMHAMKDMFSTAAFCTACAAVVGAAGAMAAVFYATVLSPAMAGVAQYAMAMHGTVH